MTEREELLGIVLDELLPRVEHLAGAGTMGLAASVRRDAEAIPALGIALAEILDALGESFAQGDGRARVAALESLQRERPRAYAGLINLAYNAYYTDARVLARIEARTGYAASAPQPRGYELHPFDERLLDRVREHPPSWRHA